MALLCLGIGTIGIGLLFLLIIELSLNHNQRHKNQTITGSVLRMLATKVNLMLCWLLQVYNLSNSVLSIFNFTKLMICSHLAIAMQ